MTKLSKLATVTVLSAGLTLGGCAKQKFIVQSGGGQLADDGISSFILGGIGQEDKIDAGQICGGGQNVLRIETELTDTNVLAYYVTLGIYTPRQYRVFCKK